MTEFRPPDSQADRKILLLEAKKYIETDAMPSDAQPTDEKRFKADEDSFFKNLATLAKVLKEEAIAVDSKSLVVEGRQSRDYLEAFVSFLKHTSVAFQIRQLKALGSRA